MKQAKEDLEKTRFELEQARREGNYEKAGRLQYAVIPALEAKLPKDGDSTPSGALVHDAVDADDIARVVSRSTGIPVQKLMTGEVEKLVHMEEELGKHVRGQEEALRAVSDAVRLQRAGLTPENRPMASFMFLGPTGVGKTELCKQVRIPHDLLRVTKPPH